MNVIEAAIMRTILYADIFQFPLTADELHRYLIAPHPIPADDLHAALRESAYLQTVLHQEAGYITLVDHAEYIAIRCERENHSRALLPDALRYGQWLSLIPFVRMVALTGALAMRNPAGEDDDFDYLLVTTPGRVWLARLFAVILVRLVRLFNRELCPNYVLASDQMLQTRQDLFIAHELTQMRPLYGFALYRIMCDDNQWTTAHLPNALPLPDQPHSGSRIKMLLEKIFATRLGNWLEAWEYRRKQRKFQPRIHQPASHAHIDAGNAKGHFEDNGVVVMRQYHQRLAQYGIVSHLQD